ncbi:MAG: FAD-dependent oxidoreductase, partial [Proteobacteria bacterium]
MTKQNFDVAVIGGAIAGCTAAILFAREGLKVALVERHGTGAGFKQLCTHFIQPSATQTIRRLGLAEKIEAAGAIRNAVDMWTPWGWIDEPEMVDD